jgi:HAD superfamily hydrolase (TIGR01509 family)
MANSIRALLFDFDGLILDTETLELGVWKTIYAEHGFEYPMHLGLQNAGLWGNTAFDPVAYLYELTKDSLDTDAIRRRHHDESTVLIARQPARAGVQDYLSEARRLGLRLAVASSSPRYWVESHLTRLGLLHRFDSIITGDDVPPGRTKPLPDIYLKALDVLKVTASEAVALEDSPYGVAAARAAGIFVVAVPNPTTARLKHEGADFLLGSLSDMPLQDLLQRAEI